MPMPNTAACAQTGVLIAMSGGVDSSVAALLVQQSGQPCMGGTMRLFAQGQTGACGSGDDAAEAAASAARLGIPHQSFDFSADFRREVIDRFAAAYAVGRTPNPCIECNRHLKFARLLCQARTLGYSHIATGHYARIQQDSGGRFLLRRAADESKDQSYVLYALSQDQLAHTLLPLGGLTKAQVRRLAAEHGFANAQKKESQDICFVPDGDYAGFLQAYRGKAEPPGAFVDAAGTALGRHQGISHYTIGQRRGIGLSFPQPMYVTGISAGANTVTLGPGQDLFATRLQATALNWVAVPGLAQPQRVLAKIRYRQPAQWTTAEQTGPDSLRLLFDSPQRAITPGQAVVLYQDDVVLGGGTIT